MLNRIHIEHFRCLKDVDVPLRPLTALIGQNDSGKSAFLAAIEFLAGVRAWSPSDAWRMAAEPGVVTGTLQRGTFRRVSSGKTEGLHGQNPLERCILFRTPSDGVSMISPGHIERSIAPDLDRFGGRLPALLDHFLRRDRSRFDSIVETLRSLIPGFEDVNIETPDNAQNREIELVVDGGLQIRGQEASVGVRLMLFFVGLVFHPNPPVIILLEEPENGVHPRRLADIIRLLRELTQGKHAGHAVQVILTTHSPYLLDFVDPATDQVLVFRRDKDGFSRSAEPVDAERLKGFLNEFQLGEVWYNQGEDGLVSRKA